MARCTDTGGANILNANHGVQAETPGKETTGISPSYPPDFILLLEAYVRGSQ